MFGLTIIFVIIQSVWLAIATGKNDVVADESEH